MKAPIEYQTSLELLTEVADISEKVADIDRSIVLVLTLAGMGDTTITKFMQLLEVRTDGLLIVSDIMRLLEQRLEQDNL